jgi:hypothetical protein
MPGSRLVSFCGISAPRQFAPDDLGLALLVRDSAEIDNREPLVKAGAASCIKDLLVGHRLSTHSRPGQSRPTPIKYALGAVVSSDKMRWAQK